MGSALGAPSQKDLKARVKTTPSLPIQGLDPNARIQLAEMAEQVEIIEYLKSL